MGKLRSEIHRVRSFFSFLRQLTFPCRWIYLVRKNDFKISVNQKKVIIVQENIVATSQSTLKNIYILDIKTKKE